MKVWIVIGAGSFGDMERYAGVYASLEGALESVNGVIGDAPEYAEDDDRWDDEHAYFHLVDMSKHYEGSHEHDFYSTKRDGPYDQGYWIQEEEVGA